MSEVSVIIYVDHQMVSDDIEKVFKRARLQWAGQVHCMGNKNLGKILNLAL